MRLSKDMRAMVAHLDTVVRKTVTEVVADFDARAEAYGNHVILLSAELEAARADTAFLTTAYDERITDLQNQVEDYADVAQARDEALSRVRELETELDAVAEDRRAVRAELQREIVRLTETLGAARTENAAIRQQWSLNADDLKGQIARLKAERSPSPQPSPLQRVEGATAGNLPAVVVKVVEPKWESELTPLAEDICELVGRGLNDQQIAARINAKLPLNQQLNGPGVKAIRELLIGRAA